MPLDAEVSNLSPRNACVGGISMDFFFFFFLVDIFAVWNDSGEHSFTVNLKAEGFPHPVIK